MPFQSASQARACWAKHDPNWNCASWAHETPDIKALPERLTTPEETLKKSKLPSFRRYLPGASKKQTA